MYYYKTESKEELIYDVHSVNYKFVRCNRSYKMNCNEFFLHHK